MSITVTMPQLGETVTEGTILSWAKGPGDEIAEDEVLLEISTDKVDTEVPSPATGVIQEILVAEGETVEVGAPLAIIAEAGESSVPTPVESKSDETSIEEPAASPAVIIPSDVKGSAAGTIEAELSTTKSDVPAAESSVAEIEPEVPTAEVADPAVTESNVTAVPDGSSEETAAIAGSSETEPPASTGGGSTNGSRRANLSPIVRKIASERNIDLDLVPGTGEGGRITRNDVMRFVAVATVPSEVTTTVTFEPAPEVSQEEAVVSPSPAPAPAPAAPTPAPVASIPAGPAAPAPAPAVPAPAPSPPAELPHVSETPGTRQVPISRLRKRIAQNMVASKATAAHVWTVVEVDFERVERVRSTYKTEFKAREGYSLTYLPFISRATIDALAAFPVVNSAFHLDEGVQMFNANVNLGIAVDMNEEGLVVVTVKNADGLRLKGLARDIRTKAMRAKDGKLEPDDISGSTFTITNPGPFGSFMSAPIINVPNVAILSTDTVTKRATVVTLPDGSDSIAIHHIGMLGLTWDHRAFDGSTALLFLNRIKNNLENWDWGQELS